MPLLAGVPARLPFFYGHIIVLVAIVCSISVHFGNMFINIFTMARVYDEYDSLGMKRSTVSLMWMFGSLAAAVCTPFYGMAIDRWGGRVCVPVGLLAQSASMLLLATSGPELPRLLFLPLAFFMMRSSSNGAVSPFCQTVVNQWFHAKRGKAIGFMGIATMLIPAVPVVGTAALWQHSLDTLGWRLSHVRSTPQKNDGRPLFWRPFWTVTEPAPCPLVPLSGFLASRRREQRKNGEKTSKNGRDMV